jgi:hypothetical protein
VTRYVALHPIDHGGARAYSAGDPVHEDNVVANGYVVGEQVADADSDQAIDALRALGILPPADEPETVPVDTDETAVDTIDPDGATVEQVNDHLDRHPDQAAAVLATERAGKSRAGIIHGRHGALPDVAEA